MRGPYRLLAGLMLIGLLSAACESRSVWEGRYVGQTGPGPGGAVTLILQAGGKGQWSADQESTPLRWEERSGALWLHLKSGGVMVAQLIPVEKALSLELPGVGALVLRRVQQ
jgi:hypothetical protein